MKTLFQSMVIKMFNIFKKTNSTNDAAEALKLQHQLSELITRIKKNEESIEKLTEQVLQLSDMLQLVAGAHAELANDISKVYNALSGHVESKSSSSILRFPLVPNDDDDLIN